MPMLLKIFTVGGGVALAIISLMMIEDDTRMWIGIGFAFLLLTAGAAPMVFKRIAQAIADKVCKEDKKPSTELKREENQKIIDRFED